MRFVRWGAMVDRESFNAQAGIFESPRGLIIVQRFDYVYAFLFRYESERKTRGTSKWRQNERNYQS